MEGIYMVGECKHSPDDTRVIIHLGARESAEIARMFLDMRLGDDRNLDDWIVRPEQPEDIPRYLRYIRLAHEPDCHFADKILDDPCKYLVCASRQKNWVTEMALALGRADWRDPKTVELAIPWVAEALLEVPDAWELFGLLQKDWDLLECAIDRRNVEEAIARSTDCLFWELKDEPTGWVKRFLEAMNGFKTVDPLGFDGFAQTAVTMVSGEHGSPSLAKILSAAVIDPPADEPTPGENTENGWDYVRNHLSGRNDK